MDKKTTHTVMPGAYHLLKRLSCGNLTEVVLATKVRDPLGRRLFIIKKLHPHIAKDSKKLQEFTREAEISTSLLHHNIVHGHEFGLIEDAEHQSYYIVLEFVFGQNLAQIMKRCRPGSLPVDIACDIMRKVAIGLEYAHTYCNPLSLQDEPIVHKDISPDNIFISYSGEIKISDFGISSKGISDFLVEKIAGKLSYMSPEQILNKQLDHRSDIYSLGVVFWECLTGNKLFSDRHKDTIKDLVIPDIQHPGKFNAAVPKTIGNICMDCLEIDPGNRFQSAQALADALLDYSRTIQKDAPDIKTYLQQQFAREFENDTKMLLPVQESDLSQHEMMAITNFATAIDRSVIQVSRQTSSLTPSGVEYVPDGCAAKPGEIAGQTANEIQPVLRVDQDDDSPTEHTLVVSLDDRVSTAEFESTGTIAAEPGQGVVAEALTLQQNRLERVMADPSQEVTQTDYELTI